MRWRELFQQLDREALTGRQIHTIIQGDDPRVPTLITRAWLVSLVQLGVLEFAPVAECNPGIGRTDANAWTDDRFYSLSPGCSTEFRRWMDT